MTIDPHLAVTVPAAMPVLSRGKHRNPAKGACFMEYTSLLAGEPFSDAPRCVDGVLAAVLRGANDQLSDIDRPRLLPLIGRAIGLAVEPPPSGSSWRGPAAARRRHREEVAGYQRQVARLRHEVCRRFLAAVGASPYPVTHVWSGWEEELHFVFWDRMPEPTPPRDREEYVQRLIDRLDVLHGCYETALDDLGLRRSVRSREVAARSPGGPAVRP
jgi:hypothetical protein